MAQDAFFHTEQGNDPRESRDAAWDYVERLRDPRCGSGVDEEPICGGGPNWLSTAGGYHFPRPDHRTLSIFKG